MISFVLHKNINESRWDNCIKNSENGLIYGLYNYLNIVAPNWNAIIIDDYKAIMPLPYKLKFGIKYIYHPYFTQQLGLFNTEVIDYSLSEILAKIPKTFIKYEISFNAGNNFEFNPQFKRINYLLDLNHNYDKVQSDFNTNTKRNIKKSIKSDLTLSDNITVHDFLELKRMNMVNRLNHSHFEILKTLFQYLIDNNLAQLHGAINSEGKLLASVIFTHFKNRMVYLFSASNSEGKEKSAMFLIVDSIVKQNCNKKLVLDFEGSMVPGVGQFFKGFGAKPEYYYRSMHNNIPFFKT